MNHRDRARPYETMQRWGIATFGELSALPAAELSSRLGRRGIALQQLARGLDPAPFVPDGETPRFVGRLELEWPIDALEPLSFVLARLLEPLSASLERADRGAAAVRLDLRLTDRATHSRMLQLPAPMRDPRVLRTLLLLDLESHPPPPLRGFGETSPLSMAIDAVAVELDPAPSRITQFSLLQRALPSPETLSTLTARLAALVGESRAGTPVLIDTHEPGAFEMARFTLDERAISSRRSDEVAKADAMERYAPEQRGAGSARGAGGAGGARGAQGAEVRGAEVRETEVRGLSTEARRAKVGAEVLRRQRVPPAIRVGVEHGRPVHIASSKRGLPYGAIVQAAGPWRTSGGWWLAAVPATPGRDGGWNRNEWDVALTGGALCRIFQDRTTDRWFFDGLYD